jgi:hypothetical protein
VHFAGLAVCLVLSLTGEHFILIVYGGGTFSGNYIFAYVNMSCSGTKIFQKHFRFRKTKTTVFSISNHELKYFFDFFKK